MVSREVGRLKANRTGGLQKRYRSAERNRRGVNQPVSQENILSGIGYMQIPKCIFSVMKKVNSAILCFTVLYSFYLSGNPDEIDSQNPPLSHFCTWFVGWWNDWVLELGFFSSSFHLLFSWIHFLFIKKYLLKNIYLF